MTTQPETPPGDETERMARRLCESELPIPRTERVEIAAHMRALQADNERLQRENDAACAFHDCAAGERDMAESRCGTAEARIAELESELDAARKSQSAWEKEWHKEVVKGEEMRKRIKQLEQDAGISEGVCEELQAELNTACGCVINESGNVETRCDWHWEAARMDMTTIDMQNKEIAQLKARIADLERDVAAHDAGRELDAATMREYEARIAELDRELDETRWDRDAAQTSAEHISKIQTDVSRLYDELLYQVGIKHPDETRHETALRYLRNAEKSQDGACKSEALPNDG